MPKLQGRILAIDYGTARIGLAKSDLTGVVAQSFGVLKRSSDANAISEIVEIAKDQEIDAIIVGLPKNMDGSLGERALHCQQFAEQLAAASGLIVELYDERLTTVSAERILLEADVSRKRRRQVIDAVAATVLLQSFLDKQN
jgi:putative Holliday junction resolvase